ncbi:hypothetical protein PanWU01x14_302130 [Parasponia andersonii]|uniref:RNase H type-1 domain-containing protein n=1 Tax=Parasponia andersonii TaxID=3476 RepID=A0A2P5ATI8_PARAD|nr:hypothetical protein PanWU01x14_302130 [Parasponia andersonii]
MQLFFVVWDLLVWLLSFVIAIGTVLGAKSMRLPGLFNPLTAELCAIREGLLFARKHDFIVKIIESDSTNTVVMTNSNSGLSLNNSIATDIITLMRLIGVVLAVLFPGLGMKLPVHYCQVLFVNTSMEWIREIPSCIASVVANDTI